MDKVTFVMPAYNVEKYLREAVESVLAQTDGDWNLIIVDDASTDKTPEIAQSYAERDARIKFLRNPHQSGSAYIPRKRAIKDAVTEWIAPLDADDKIPPGYLENLFRFQRSARADIIYPVMYSWDGKVEKAFPNFDFSFVGKVFPGKEALRYTLDGWRMHCGGGIVKRGLYLKAFDFIRDDESGPYRDEFLSRVLLYIADKIGISSEKYLYRINPTSVTHNISGNSFDLLRNNLHLLDFVGRRYEEDSEMVLLSQRQNFHGFFDGLRILRDMKLGRDERRSVENLLRECRRRMNRRILWGNVSWKYFLLSSLPYSFSRKLLGIMDTLYQRL